MILEAIDKPLRLRLRNPDRTVTLQPGQPIDLPPLVAWKLLRQAPGKVRLVVNPDSDWLTLWQQVAEISDGLESTDARLSAVLKAIDICDAAFELGNKERFLVGIATIAQAMEGSKKSTEVPKGNL